jgi:hypothetical protein
MLNIVLDELGLRLTQFTHTMRLPLEILTVNERFIGSTLLADRTTTAFTHMLSDEQFELFTAYLAVVSFASCGR